MHKKNTIIIKLLIHNNNFLVIMPKINIEMYNIKIVVIYYMHFDLLSIYICFFFIIIFLLDLLQFMQFLLSTFGLKDPNEDSFHTYYYALFILLLVYYYNDTFKDFLFPI